MQREFDDLREILEPMEEVPPMPEETHARWTQAVRATAQTAVRSAAPWKRTLAAAAAAVFVLGGTALTRDQLSGRAPEGETGLVTASYSRTMKSSSAYDGGSDAIMLAAGASNEAAMMDTAAAPETRKLIRTIDLSIGTRTYDASLTAITEGCTAAGGWVENLSESSGDSRSAYMTLRIPADALETFLAGTGHWGRMIHRSENTQDVTESYQDTQARLATQQALMARLQSLVADAADLSDLLALESQIADTQYEIDRLTGILLRTDRQVDYATVSVNLREESIQDDAENPDLSLAQRLSAGLATGWRFVVEWAGDVLVFLVSASPVIIPLAALWGAVRLIRRKRRRR